VPLCRDLDRNLEKNSVRCLLSGELSFSFPRDLGFQSFEKTVRLLSCPYLNIALPTLYEDGEKERDGDLFQALNRSFPWTAQGYNPLLALPFFKSPLPSSGAYRVRRPTELPSLFSSGDLVRSSGWTAFPFLVRVSCPIFKRGRCLPPIRFLAPPSHPVADPRKTS